MTYEKVKLRGGRDKCLILVFTYEKVKLVYISNELQWRVVGTEEK
jgi:hypothetical protein